MEVLTVRDLSYQYRLNGPVVLNQITFQLAPGEILAVAGLSGCGKSTLCHCLSGIVPRNLGGILRGEILVKGRNIQTLKLAKLAFEIGLVFQDPDVQLFSTTVEDEIAFAPENMCLAPSLIRERVDRVAEELELTDFLSLSPGRLSGGEKHLVALAAVLALDPPVLVLDEVMSQLDSQGKDRVAAALEKLRLRGKGIIIVEHDLEGIAFSDRMLVLERGEVIRQDQTGVILADRDFLRARGLLFEDPSGQLR